MDEIENAFWFVILVVFPLVLAAVLMVREALV